MANDKMSSEATLSRLSAVARACDRCPEAFKTVHDFVMAQLDELPKGSGETAEARMMSKLSKVYSNAVARPAVRAALEKIHGEAVKLDGSNAPTPYIAALIVGEFIVVGGLVFAGWCAYDPSGC